MNELLKRFVPIRLKHALKIGFKLGEYEKRISGIGTHKNHNLLVGTPLHKNLGDHLIALAEKQYLQEIGIEQLTEIPLSVFLVFKKKIIKNNKNISRVFISGGGWMGNIWPEDERALLDMVEAFSELPVFVFPQTIFWDFHKDYVELMARDSSVMNDAKNMVFCAREEQTFEYIQKHYRKSRNLLLPDIALKYKCVMQERKMAVQQVGICLRSDLERTTKVQQKELLISEMKKRSKEVVILSTMSNWSVSEKGREDAVKDCMKEFSCCSCIITDRLHGMIISALVGVPCIVFDNKTKKVSGVYEAWLKKYDLIRLVDDQIDVEKVCDLADELMCGNDKYDIDFTDEFYPLTEEILWKKSND